jgi:hypothetical protein
MFHYYDLGYCEAFVFDEFLINQIREGSTITKHHSEVLDEVITKHFGDKPIVYISNRVMSYAVDPITYLDAAKIKNLIAIAIVTQDPNFKKSAEYERKFYNKPFKIFTTLSDAIAWVQKVALPIETTI